MPCHYHQKAVVRLNSPKLYGAPWAAVALATYGLTLPAATAMRTVRYPTTGTVNWEACTHLTPSPIPPPPVRTSPLKQAGHQPLCSHLQPNQPPTEPPARQEKRRSKASLFFNSPTAMFMGFGAVGICGPAMAITLRLCWLNLGGLTVMCLSAEFMGFTAPEISSASSLYAGPHLACLLMHRTSGPCFLDYWHASSCNTPSPS